MSTNSVPALPLEVLHTIIGDVADKRTLKQCSLISRSLCAPSQQALFSSISLEENAQVIAFLDESPHIARYVKSLTLFGRALEDHRIRMLLNVRHLILVAYAGSEDFDPLPADIFRFQQPFLSSITTLHLEDLVDVPFDAMSCPNLREMTLKAVTSLPTVPSRDCAPHSLRSLTLLKYQPQDFTDGISLMSFLSDSSGPLTSICFKDQFRQYPDAQNFLPLISRYKDSLEVLELQPLHRMCLSQRSYE